MGKKRTQPFEIRKGQYWACQDKLKKPKMLLGEVEKTTKNGEVKLFCAMQNEYITLSKEVLLADYAYISKKAADKIHDEYDTNQKQGIVQTDLLTRARESIRLIKPLPIVGTKSAQETLPFEEKKVAPPVPRVTPPVPKAAPPSAPAKDVLGQAAKLEPKDPQVFKKSLDPVEVTLVMKVRHFVKAVLKAFDIALSVTEKG